MITKIIPVLNQEGFNLNTDSVLKGIKEQVSGKKSKSAKSEEVVQEPVPPPKKQLKIVRRIKPTPVVVEETPPEPLASEVKQVTIIKPTIKEETFPRIIKEEPKPPQIKTPSEPSNISQANKLKSIETRKPYQPSAQPIQPFRVAKPTMVPSMMGRTKRPHAKGGHQQKEKEKKETETVATITKPVLVTITNAMTVKELAERLILPETEVVKNLFAKKIIKTVNQTVELEIAIECAKSFGYAC